MEQEKDLMQPLKDIETARRAGVAILFSGSAIPHSDGKPCGNLCVPACCVTESADSET